MMTKLLSLLLLTSILAIGIFGFASMSHNDGHSTGCVASTIDNTQCPENIVEMSVHHIQAYLTFFSVILTTPILLSILILVFLMLVGFSAKLAGFQYAGVDRRLIRKKLEIKVSILRKLIRWLSLFENSPSFAWIFINSTNLNYTN